MKDITEFIGVQNIAEKLDDDLLTTIAHDADTGYDIDKQSREGWEKKNKQAVELAEQVWEQKDFPFKSASNVKYPLIATASIQFAARAYPNFVKGPDIVKGLVIGDDPDGLKAAKATRVGQHMSYQFLNEMTEWEEDTDKLLTYIPIIGCAFKKTYFNKVLQRNVSEFRRAEDIVINYMAKSMETAPRITDIFTLYPNEIEERIRGGIYLEFEPGLPTSTKEEDKEVVTTDPDQPHVFLEQHCCLDLDDDGYKEPYIITFHKDTKKAVRIVARFDRDSIEYGIKNKIVRINADQYFTKFPFMPSISGSIYDTGFGGLLSPINSTINTTINQLLDAGTLYNLNGGFLGKGIQLGRGRGGGVVEFGANEWKQIMFTGDDLRKHIFPLPVKEPSLVLFNLLGFMVQAGERLSSVTEILTGQQSNEAERPTTTLARIEQGLKVFSSIHKRLYRAFKSEYVKIFALNRKYLQPMSYFRVLDNPQAIPREDYDTESCDVVPVADPNETTNTQKLIRGQIWMSMKGQGFNDAEINKRFAEAMQEPEPEKLLESPPPPPDPKMVIEMQKLELEKSKFQFEMLKFGAESEERNAKVARLLAQAQDSLAKAESYEVGQQLDLYKSHLTALVEEFKVQHGNQQGRVGSLEAGKPGNAGGAQGASGAQG
jgi:chaperonin GroES